MSLPLEVLSWHKEKQDNVPWFTDQEKGSVWRLKDVINSGAYKKVRVLANDKGGVFCLLTPAIRDQSGKKYSFAEYGKKRINYVLEKNNWARISELNLGCMAKVCAFVIYKSVLGAPRSGILMHYYPEGSLHSACRSLNSDVTMKIAHKILSNVHQLHACDIVHKDIKEENLLLEKCGEEYNIKIIDLNFLVFEASKLMNHDKTFHPSGTRTHLAPELLYGQKDVYDYSHVTKIDAYSVGVILRTFIRHASDRARYDEMTSSFIDGLPPEGSNCLNVWLDTYKNYGKYLKNSSDSFSRLVGGLLEFNPKKRLTVGDALEVFEKEVLSSSNEENVQYI